MANSQRKLTQDNYNKIRDHLFDRIHKTGEQVKNDFPNILRAAIESQAWQHFTDAEGKPFKNLVDWLHYTYPNGASMGQGKHAISYDEALKLTEAVSDVHRVLEKASPPKRDLNTDGSNPRPGRRSIYQRLQEENPGEYQAYLFGQHKSVTEAAKAGGIVKARPHQNLLRAKSAFRKMTSKERAEFLKWVKEGNL